MPKTDLKKILNLIINEEMEQADSLLHKWFVEQTRQIHESILEDDGSIKRDQDSIEAEEYFGEDDLSGDLDDDSLDRDAEDEAEQSTDDDDGLDDSDDTESGEDLSTDPEEISDQFDDMTAQLERLQKEFLAITGEEDEDDDSIDSQGIGDSEVPDMDSEDDLTSEGITEDEDEDEDENSDEDSDDLDESLFDDIDFDSLSEDISLKPVKTKTGKGEVGNGKSFKENGKSPLPQEKVSNRVKGTPVKIKSDDHKGFDREKSPSLKDSATGDNSRKCSMAGTSKVPPKGSNKATLNKEEGFGKNNSQSPISGKMRKKTV